MARLIAICAGILFLHVAGCSCVATKQDWHYQFTNWRRASTAFDCCYTKEKQKCLGRDFEQGFKRGFIDTSMGKDCQVPAVPPPRYWSAKYQCASGQAIVQSWFCGYEQGIVASQSAGYPEFNEVPVSTGAPILNKTACGMCQSCDPCSCNASCGAHGVNADPSMGAGDHFSQVASPPAIKPADVTSNSTTSDDLVSEQRVSAKRVPVRAAVENLPRSTPPAAPDYWSETQPSNVEPPVKPSRPVQLTGDALETAPREFELPPLPNSIGIIGGEGAIRQSLVGPSDREFLFAKPATLASGEAPE